MRTKNLVLPWLLGVGPLVAASVSATVTMGQGYCHVVSFPHGWELSPIMKRVGRDRFEFGSSKLEFRATEADTPDLLVGIHFGDGPRTRAGDYSPDKYWVDMRHGGRARAATEQEWNAGFRLGALSKPYWNGHFLPYPPKDNEDLVLQGRSFKKSGALWEASFDLTRVSQDGQWLMVHSIGGTRQEKRGGGNGDVTVNFDFFKPHHEAFFIDIYKFATAQRVIAIHGSMWGEDSTLPGDVALWLQSRYFVVPMQAHYKELLVCDMKDLSPEEKELR